MREVRRVERLPRMLQEKNPGAKWRCAVCGTTWKKAERARQQRGQHQLRVNATLCGALDCARERDRRGYKSR
jgi:hypothetical protein